MRIGKPQVDSIDADGARLRIVEAQQELEHRRLACARGTDEGDVLAGGDIERKGIQRRRIRARRIAERNRVERDRPAGRIGHRERRVRRADLRHDREELEEPFGRSSRPLEVADDFADRADRTGDDHRVEHECGQLPRADAPGDDVVPADPENDPDGAEHEQDHARDQPRALADSKSRRLEGVLDAFAEASAIDAFVAVGLDRADLVQRLVDVGADVTHAILARARQRAHPAPEQDDRDDDERNPGQHEECQLDAGDR